MAAGMQGRRQIATAHSGIDSVILPLESGGNGGSIQKKRLDLVKGKGEKNAADTRKKGCKFAVFRAGLHVALIVVALAGVLDSFAQNIVPMFAQNIMPVLETTTQHPWKHRIIVNTSKTSIPPALMQAGYLDRSFNYYLGAVDPATVRVRTNLTPNQQAQIDQFRNGNGLLLNVHIVHHGGTTFCHEIGGRLYAPSFACMAPRWPVDIVGEDYPERRPWSRQNTSTNIAVVRNWFNMISWEFASPVGASFPQMEETEWEHEQLVSVFVARDPMSRLLSGDAAVNTYHPNLAKGNATVDDWWAFARDDKFNDNYCMKVFAGRECCQGNNTDPAFLFNAKSIVERFTIVLDVACLDAGIAALGKTLGLNMSIPVRKQKTTVRKHSHEDPKDKVPYPEVYEYLVQKNKLDIEFYEWSKQRSLVNCEEFWEAEEANVPQQSVALP